jgi:hypothetical protein
MGCTAVVAGAGALGDGGSVCGMKKEITGMVVLVQRMAGSVCSQEERRRMAPVSL